MRRTFSHNIVLLFTIFLANNVSFSQEATITGKVKYGSEVLQAATVSLGAQTKFTDGNGAFTFSVTSGTYTITITHAGYKKIEQTIIAEAGSIKSFDFNMITNDQLDEVMLGSRSKNHLSNLNTPVPVDVFSYGKLVETGQISLTQMMNFLSPSFNTSREVLNETVTLRDLDPQHVLILINGIRYHPMAFIFSGNLRGQLGRGSVGNDLNSLPFPAIEKIEVLRDGAAAQYGSDAIAGVINIRLKKNAGTSFNKQVGQFYKGDGEKFSFGVYHGFSLNKKSLPADKQGFLNFSVSYRYQAPTFRGGEYLGFVYYDTTKKSAHEKDSLLILDNQRVLDRGFNRRAAIDNAGNTKIVTKGFVINGGFPINDRIELFVTTLVNGRKLNRGGIFRFPWDSSRINYLLYPDGVQPRNISNTVDATLIAGVKGKTKKEIYWDMSSSYGINSVRNSSTNSYNETQTHILGTNAQTSFYNGTDIFKQLTSDLNFSKQFLPRANQIKTLNFSWGAEWRQENYKTKPGEEASWKNYDTANYRLFNVTGTENIANKSRNVLGAYVELESEFKNNLLFNIACRYEYYSDFGRNIAVKMATRYKLSSKILLRASVNNGFRAPSLQQRYFTNIGYTLNEKRETIFSGTFPNTHKIIRALNVPLLTAEKTINVSAGFTSTVLKNVNLTVDAYWIEIKDRIVVSGSFVRREGDSLDKILDHYPEFDAINRVSFFTNAINTRTKGVDIVLDGYWSSNNESFAISLAANFNDTRIYGPVKTSDKLATISGSSNTLFNSEDRTRAEKGQPGSKIILSTIYRTGKIKLMTRNTRFGKTTIAPRSLPVENFSSKVLTDISLSYSLKKWATVTLGANNIFNIYPDPLKNYENTSQGGWLYSPEASPFGFNGGYYYLSLNFNF